MPALGLPVIDHIQMVTLPLCTGVLMAGAMVLLRLWQPGLARPRIYTCGLLFTIPSLGLCILIMPVTG
ncbi:ABC transporter permease, partial [Pseudomonas syringae pv. tagetis]